MCADVSRMGKRRCFFCRSSRWSFSVERRETGIFSAYGYVRSRRFFQPSAFHKGGRGESLSRLLSFLYFKFAHLWHFHQTHLHHRKLLECRCDPAARLAPSIPRRRRHYRQLRYGGTRRRTGVAEADNTETAENTGVPSKYLYAPYELRYDTPIPNDNAVGEAALTAPGLVGQAPPRLRFAGAGLDADMTPCGTGRKSAPAI